MAFLGVEAMQIINSKQFRLSVPYTQFRNVRRDTECRERCPKCPPTIMKGPMIKRLAAIERSDPFVQLLFDFTKSLNGREPRAVKT